MKLSYDLSIEQQQKLVMTPELIQAIKILQLSNQDLDAYVGEQVISNPILEYDNLNPEGQEGDGKALSSEEESRVSRDEIAKYIEEYGHRNRQDYLHYAKGSQDTEVYKNYEDTASGEITLAEHLGFQLQFTDVSKEERLIGKFIIESLDKNGYMTLTSEEIGEMTEADMDLVDRIIELIQSFEPYGVCASSLEDCLRRQLIQRGEFDEAVDKVLKYHLEDIGGNRLGRIGKCLGVSTKTVQKIADLIKSCEPRPGRAFFSGENARYIIPDVWVKEGSKGFEISSNEEATPRLMISAYYEKLLRNGKDDPQIVEFLSHRMDSAVWLIRAIQHRKETIQNVVTAIVDFQEDFFYKGEKFLKTLTLKDVADEIGMHESTVSRSIKGKYLQCTQGVYPLKFFFSAGVFNSDEGNIISSNSVKSHLKELIDRENVEKPYSDQHLVELLRERGIEISRRTVAKYRDEMKIPSSSKRRRY